MVSASRKDGEYCGRGLSLASVAETISPHSGARVNPILETDRLVFHPFTPDDLGLLLDLHGDPDVQRFMSPGDQALLDRLVREQADHGHSKWRVHLRDGTFIGRAGVSPYAPTGELELGYAFKAQARGQGYATEAARGVADWTFANTDRSHLIGFTDPANLASQRVLTRIGMTYLGLMPMKGLESAAVFRLDRP